MKNKYGIEPKIREFNDGTKTARDASDAIECELGKIVNSVIEN